MTTLPFAQTLVLWRTARGMTQAQLAERARIPRPNVSDIERGKREVTLSTLRALASALEIRPGVLADGVAPEPAGGSQAWSRAALERVADAVVLGKRLLRRPVEQSLAQLISQVRQGSVTPSPRRGKRALHAAWLSLRASYPTEVVESLLQRIADRERAGDQERIR